MKLIVIPPYKGMNFTPAVGHYMLHDIVDRMRKNGQLEGVEIDIDDGYAVGEHATESRDAAVYADIAGGFLGRLRLYSEGDRYDAILASGGSDIAFHASRIASKIPVIHSLHAAAHIASFIGDRFSMVASAYSTVLTCRRSAEDYGLGKKLISARFISYSSTKIAAVVRKKLAGQLDAPEVRKLIEDVMAQCVMAIEDDRVDSLLFIYPGLQCFEEEIRQALDARGYGEIPLVCGLPAAVEMARAMLKLKLKQAARANPGESLKALPKFA